MVKINKDLMYRGRLKKLYKLYDMGQIGYIEYEARRIKLTKKYER